MFSRSLATDTLQGKAIQSVNERWGHDVFDRAGRESLGINVCKKKYTPFYFPVLKRVQNDAASTENGGGGGAAGGSGTWKSKVQVERRYGCRIHTNLRRQVIEQHGERDGWEPFGQWSMKKALEMAKKETARLNSPEVMEAYMNLVGATSTSCHVDQEDDEEDVSFSSSTATSSASSSDTCRPCSPRPTVAPICNNGNCIWKVKSAYDDIYYEMHGKTESEAEEEDNNNHNTSSSATTNNINKQLQR